MGQAPLKLHFSWHNKFQTSFLTAALMMDESCLQVFQSVQNGWKSAVFSPTLDSTEAKCKQIRNVTNHLKRAGDKIIHFPLSFA